MKNSPRTSLMLALILASISQQMAQAQVLDTKSNGMIVRESAPGIIEPLVSWTKQSIHVCWRNGVDQDPAFVKNDFNNIKKQAVREIVQQEYTIERVGIEFVGWENCNELKPGTFDFEIIQDHFAAPSNPTVKYYRDQSVEGMAFLGEGGGCYRITERDPFAEHPKVSVGYYRRNSKPEKKVYLMFFEMNDVFENTFTSIKRLQSTALHEFGHVAGLRHEHIHPEAMNDSNCKYMGTDFTVSEKTYDTTRIVSEYDPNSIMNYCWLAALDAKGLVMGELPNVVDESLYEQVNRVEVTKKTVYTGKKPHQKKKTVTVKTPVTEYRFRVGLSERDVMALQALYLKAE